MSEPLTRHRLLILGDDGDAFSRALKACRIDADIVLRPAADCAALAAMPEALERTDLLILLIFQAAETWPGFFAWLGSRANRPPALAILGADTPESLLEAAARAGDDFIVWTGDRIAELRERVVRLLGSSDEAASASERLTQSVALAKLVGRDPAFLATVAKIPIVARHEGIVLVLGETGTGKELCARAVHHLSRRRHLPFVPVDCAALPDHLLENELFGHVRGAFTDAHRDQVGLVAMAERGTLFLDEIDSLALPVQAKLLRLIEERTYKPLGSDRFVHADIRIVAASNHPLDDLVRQRRFRSDLFFRLNVLQIHLPALRQRRGDIALLARHFAGQLAGEPGAPRRSLAPSTIEKLTRADWPGNVRELFNVLQRAFVFCDGPVVLPRHVSLPDEEPRALPLVGGYREARERTLRAFERAYVEQLLEKHGGNVTRCAHEAMKDRRAFGRLIKKHKIDRLAFETR